MDISVSVQLHGCNTLETRDSETLHFSLVLTYPAMPSTHAVRLSYSCLPVSPQFLHHVLHFLTPLCWSQLSISLSSELGHIHLSKLLQGEGPAMEAGAKPDCANDRVNLRKTCPVIVSRGMFLCMLTFS